ncbi:MAG TPA: alanine--glyoxylate aminotransferase family protein [Sediminispirochaeta sp.]|nr:alanine--glyoxylate aminotransferase family protein [Sediminispirochaeta sp.]
MPGLNPNVDPNGLLEYSVVFTDRSLNHMSQAFQQVMRDISSSMKKVYHAHSVALVPGGGTYAMEAVARQFAAGASVLIVRNGMFSFRWTQILEASGVAKGQTVLQARRSKEEDKAPCTPAPLEEIVDSIRKNRPDVVFVPHVETSSGIILPEEYIQGIGEATREVGGLFVLDCVASGAVWVDMEATKVDVLITAPQKGWSSTPSAGMVMLNERARKKADETKSSSFACDLGAWLRIMDAYENGGHAYHATMPTDSLRSLRDTIREIEGFGLEKATRSQLELGEKVRALLEERGFPSVAAPGFKAPGVVVSYTDDEGIRTGKKFAQAGLQIAAGVPLKCDEPEGFSTFRVGLFGLEKLRNVDRTVEYLKKALDEIA